MIKKKIIVSSCDSKYFNLLTELFLSLKNKNIMDEYNFGVLNTGMNQNQINYLKDNNVIIKEAIWNAKVPEYKILGRDHLKTRCILCWLQDIFSLRNNLSIVL